MIVPTMDLISIKAFIKHRVRTSLSNERFTHWLPLYFGEKDIIEVKKKELVDKEKNEWKDIKEIIKTEDRLVTLLKKSLSFICTGSTRKPFKP